MLLWNTHFFTVLINALWRCDHYMHVNTSFWMKTCVFFFKELSKKSPIFLIKCTKVKVIALRLLEGAISIDMQSLSFRFYSRKLLRSILGSCNLYTVRNMDCGYCPCCPAGGVPLLLEMKEMINKFCMWDPSRRKIYNLN